jgi:glycine/D-amino acid oxidase-like deaminating enzyme
LSDAQWQAIGIRDLTPMVDTRKLVTYYRRLPDHRLLLGARSDTWGSARNDAEMQATLLHLVKKKFPDAGAIPVDFFWRGLVTVSRKMTPAWGRSPDDHTISFNLGCFGSGVNTMPWMGRTIARSIAGIPLTPREACAVYRSLPPRLPASPLLQRTGLKLAYLLYALKDHYA